MEDSSIESSLSNYHHHHISNHLIKRLNLFTLLFNVYAFKFMKFHEFHEFHEFHTVIFMTGTQHAVVEI